jgi:hypothetical protein
VIQQSFTELIPSVNKRSPSIWPDDSINREASAALKLGHGVSGGVSKDARTISSRVVPEGREPCLDVLDTLSPVTLVKKPHELSCCSSPSQPM